MANLEVDPGDYIRLSFRDSGCGIDGNDIERIFDPYFSTKPGGTGLGLATAFSIIRKHGGRITVTSQPGDGSEFIILLPESSGSGETDSSGTDKAAESKIENISILVMDDEEVVRSVAGTMLEHLGYRVETAADGREAVRKYVSAQHSGDPFHLLVFDLTVPGGMGGEEAVREILKINPDAKAIVSSGYADSPVMANHTQYGFKGIMAKPYTLRVLQDVIDSTLKS